MRKIISICLLLMLLLSCAVCVYADGQMDVIFTSNSSFSVGGKATVDLTKTAQTVMDDGAITSDMYNAALEENMSVSWICSNGTDKKGTSVTWTTEDAGKEYTCRVGFYADKELTEFVGFVDSQPFTVSGGSGSDTPKNPNITTKTLPEATVGQSYYVKLDCTDPDASFGEWYNPGKANDLSKTGLVLTQHGELEGTPSKVGSYTFTIYAAGEGGEGYMTYTLVVKEAAATDPTESSTEETTEPGTEETSENTDDATEAVSEPDETTDSANPSESPAQKGEKDQSENQDNDTDGGDIWIFVGIGLGVLVVGMVAAIVVILKKKA